MAGDTIQIHLKLRFVYFLEVFLGVSFTSPSSWSREQTNRRMEEWGIGIRCTRVTRTGQIGYGGLLLCPDHHHHQSGIKCGVGSHRVPALYATLIVMIITIMEGFCFVVIVMIIIAQWWSYQRHIVKWDRLGMECVMHLILYLLP